MKRNNKNIILQKREELSQLNEESNDALDLVTSTINRLDNINTRIDVVLEEIKDAKNSLQETEDGLVATRDHNSKIAEKFKMLIAG